ncbi:P-loop containing nucleoside triphosphate hydrolase protein [Suillus fuscotomentosus]|uniref:P-loop containing nucleoside triphosphate hydrolase protein n=1 Tax=Suillus fuscotomentosus TaxID=1912939 RepID=A0AAD4DUC6_9AGAM|nr:P-loop containing nucleoside triphosphate hydrolase protein [Suillus fuscotomentosus]KAG1894055.1 P-loop containing nucleoside triphosphate hydrolase protein [Suillus fuscotomentosus]
MPTITMPGALLALSSPSHAEEADSSVDAIVHPGAGHVPWCWPVWQQRTTLSSTPLSATVNEDTPSAWKSLEVNQAVLTFARNFWAVDDAAQVDYIKKDRSDNDNKGRQHWLDYCHANWSNWKINHTVDAVLAERGLDAYSVMKRLKVANLPDLATSQVALAYSGIAEALFGPESLTEDGIALKEPVRRFLDALMTHCWAKNRKSIGRERERLGKLKSKIDQTWKEFSSMAEHGQRLDAEGIRTWLKDVDGLTKILTRYGDQESLKQLSEQQETLSDLLQGLGIEVKGGSKYRLPKPLRQALSFLATQQDITLLTASIHDQLKLCDPNAMPDEPIPEFDPDAPTDCDFQWSEGVEEYNNLSEDDIWSILGLPEKRIPFFNLLQDPYGNCDPWTEDGQTWLKENGEPLSLRWHQLVGLVKMVKNTFGGKPVLLMDEVGLGKTIQVTALIAVLSFYREFYTMHHRFPGKIAADQWRSDSPNIPNLPVMLVIPANLVMQFTSELHRFLQRGTFDVLPYLATWSSRRTWWEDIWSQSKQPEGRRIIITAPKALESDCDRIFETNNRTPTKHPRRKTNYTTDVSSTAYGRDFLLGIVDEAHNYRNIKKGYWAIFCLRFLCHAMVAMTATPITSRPLDIWNIGRCLGLELFGGSYDDEAKKMVCQLRAASAKDRKRFKQGDRTAKIIMGTVKGDADLDVPSLYRNQMLTWISVIRERFTGIVIRRTVRSVDNHGDRISGLAPFLEHNLLVKLYPHEVVNLERIAQEIVEQGGASAAKYASGSDFYTGVRRALLHASCNAGYPWANPSTLEEWKKDPSRKLDILAQVLCWHLEYDGRLPLCVLNDALVVSSADPEAAAGVTDSMPCDKMLVYCAFPSSYTQVLKVLELNHISTLQIHGKLSASARTDIIAQFKSSRRDGPRVLIISNVGLTGLNLPCANILIIVDSLWSATDEGQLIGRIYRPPQPKTVHVYRIVAADTQDVFLNNISFSKAAILDAFTGATPSLRSLFRHDDEADEMNALSDTDDAPSKKGKTKSKTSKAGSSKKKPSKARGKGVKPPSGRLSGKPAVQPLDQDSAIKKPGEKSLLAPPTSPVIGPSPSGSSGLQVKNHLGPAASPRQKSPPAPTKIVDPAERGDITQSEVQTVISNRSAEDFQQANPTQVKGSQGGQDITQSEVQAVISNRSAEDFQQANPTQVKGSQGGQDSQIILPLKRTADSSLENQVSKAPKLTSGDNHEVSTFLADMQQHGIGVDRLYAFLKSLPNDSSSQNPGHPLASFLPGSSVATELSTPAPLNPTSSRR